MTSSPFPPGVRVDGSHHGGCHCVDCRLSAARRDASKQRRKRQIADRNLRELLTRYLARWLVDPRDFDTFIGLGAVTNSEGAIDWVELERRVRLLLELKPHLAVSDPAPTLIARAHRET